MAAISASLGGLKGGGGIWRVRIFMTAFSHVCGSRAIEAVVPYAWRSTSAFLSRSLWQR